LLPAKTGPANADVVTLRNGKRRAAQEGDACGVRPVIDEAPRQSREEQADLLRRALAAGYRDVAAAEADRASATVPPAEPAA
jgi:hypothetical protein